MSTTEPGNLDIPQGDQLDAALIDLFAVQPSPGVLGRIDDRIDHALRGQGSPAARRPRLRPGRRAGFTVLVAAVFVLGGASGGLQALYGLLAGPFDLPWHRGVELNLSQVVDGYRVTLNRAYADSTRLALAISVVDERQREGTTQIEAFSTIVTDESGEYGGVGAASSPDGRYAAANVAWKTPAAIPLPAGPRWFHVVVPFIRVRDDTSPPPNADAIGWNPWHQYPGPWTFDFELTVDGGTTIAPNAVIETDGVQITVSRVIAASNIVRVEVKTEGDVPAGWMPVGEIRHGMRVLRIVASSVEADGTVALLTDTGVEDASGAWTVALEDADTPRRGPWIVTFDGP